MMKRTTTALLTLVLAVSAGIADAAAPLPEVAVTTCGQIVPMKTLGYLTGDLDCSGYTGGDPAVLSDTATAVTLGRHAKLDLRGFTTHGVLCDNIRADARKSSKCEVFNGTVSGAAQRGVAGRRIFVHDLTATQNGVGVYAYGNPSRIENVVVTDGPYDGVRVRKIKAFGLTITGNGGNGIVGDRVMLRDSTVTGNGGGQFCIDNPGDCFDINSYERPKAVNVVCGTSGSSSDGALPTWGICSSD
jgi:hypothetical protein